MRRTHYIEQYNEHDRQAYLFLNNVHSCTKSQLNNFISINRIQNYQKENILEKIQTQNESYYKLTQKGYKILEKQFSQENHHYHSQSYEHDRKLADYYILVYKNLGADNFVWKNEEDLKQERQLLIDNLIREHEYDRAEMLRASSVVDCLIEFEDNSAHCYDVITDNYSKLDIELKYQFAQSLNLKLFTDKI